jgi:Rod binding domain-containing protein
MDVVSALTDPFSAPLQPAASPQAAARSQGVQTTGPAAAEQTRRVQLAKDFESILTTRMVEEMKNTIGQWDDEEEDGASEQVQGIFWMHLSQHIGSSGGIGLWKQIVEVMNQNDPTTGIGPSTDDSL